MRIDVGVAGHDIGEPRLRRRLDGEVVGCAVLRARLAKAPILGEHGCEGERKHRRGGDQERSRRESVAGQRIRPPSSATTMIASSRNSASAASTARCRAGRAVRRWYRSRLRAH